MKQLIFIISFIVLATNLNAQVVFPEKIERRHPRLISGEVTKEYLKQQIVSDTAIGQAYKKYKNRIDGYVNQHVTDPTWMVSRLQMYWNTHSTDVFIKGGVYSHASGEAPVPTVRFTGTRDHTTVYLRPKLEDIKPYMDDERGLWLQNKTNHKWEWVEQSKTGRIVESINSEIMGLARTAALIYWIEGDEKYAKFAADLFDTYMAGIYYRNVPYDLNHGHQQTLVGYTSFEVIQEGIVLDLAGCFDYLYDFLNGKKADQMPVYTESLRKLADQIIKNGVPFNNWDLIQANHVIQIALVLENNNAYADGRGCQYYLDRVFNRSETRQWSITDLMAYGYDPNTGIWAECPGYSKNVAGDFTHIISKLQESLGIDILPSMPIIPKVISALPQYLFPNKYTVGFGDTHYSKLGIGPMLELVANAQKFNKPAQEKEFTALAKMLTETPSGESNTLRGNAFLALFTGNYPKLDESVPAGKFSDYATQTFYAPNVSWMVQRNGLDPMHGLMISEAGSLGNHMHSNGIAIELYGKGLVLAPEGGIGTSYFQPDYAEYYSQFPAHNTVVVNGVSKYPEMKSNHGFKVNYMYPESARKEGYFPGITFSDVYFLEPETNADQNRVMSIVRTGETSGYYIDIFRSKCKSGNDKYHDYFYHNLGQKFSLTDAQNKPLELIPSERLTFADGDLFAYDYIWDKQSNKTDQDFKATFELTMKGQEKTSMNMWMKGEPDREVFKVLTPPTEAFRKEMITEEVSKSPLPAVVVRQSGEAWNRSFAVVYEPFTESEPASIRSIQPFDGEGASEAFVGLKIESLSGRTDYVFSSDIIQPSTFQDMAFTGTYGVVTTEGKKITLFLGSGKQLSKGGLKIEIAGTEAGSAVLSAEGYQLFLTADAPVWVTVPDTFASGKLFLTAGANKIQGKRTTTGKYKSVVFQVPAIAYQQVKINIEK